jgi:hypothetical protein
MIIALRYSYSVIVIISVAALLLEVKSGEVRRVVLSSDVESEDGNSQTLFLPLTQTIVLLSNRNLVSSTSLRRMLANRRAS